MSEIFYLQDNSDGSVSVQDKDGNIYTILPTGPRKDEFIVLKGVRAYGRFIQVYSRELYPRLSETWYYV